uniref:Large ribosomal subunit protein uL2m n=1 Tax=Andalucia godoyi TaxID=505711 RepID=M4QBL5_ANDGO|nr:ribosomal protein L2 [Andalucia godoyi]AGH23979.1 ribosomal protein L2 [Andalucia godoyi]
MVLKSYKPVTPSTRHLITTQEPTLWKGKPVKQLTVGLSKSGGRNNLGRITTRHRGGGHKRKYRFLDFQRNQIQEGKVLRLEYDPNRTGFLALLKNEDEKLSYILAPQGLQEGQILTSGETGDIQVGNTLSLKNIPIGTTLHNIEIYPGRGGQLCRAAGAQAQLIKKNEDGYGMIRLVSGELRLISLECKATIGSVSNADHQNICLGKAGRSRWLGRRPSVRGVAMNPVDHPHGGGQGKTSGGRPSVTPWGWSTKGKKTRHNLATDRYIVKRRK